MLAKDEARKLVIRRIKKHPNVNPNLYDKLYQTKMWQNSHVIAVTMSTKLEINTQPIIHEAWNKGKIICVPKVFQKRQMQFFQIKPHTKLIYDKFNIKEPLGTKLISSGKINLMIVPGLAFSIDTHNRLGYGGGYYDRYLKHYHGNTIALARPCQCFNKAIWPIDKFDEPINKLIC